MTKPVVDDDGGEVPPHPRPVNILPDEVLSLQQAAFYANRSERELRRELGPRHGISRKIIAGGRIEFSAPGLQLVLQGRFDLLELFRDGHRDHPEIVQLFYEFGIPGAELQTAIIARHRAGPVAKRHRALVPPALDVCDLPARSKRPAKKGKSKMLTRYDANGNDRSVELLLRGGRVLDSFRTAVVIEATKRGETVNEFVLKAAGRQLLADGADLSGVFFPRDIEGEI